MLESKLISGNFQKQITLCVMGGRTEGNVGALHYIWASVGREKEIEQE